MEKIIKWREYQIFLILLVSIVLSITLRNFDSSILCYTLSIVIYIVLLIFYVLWMYFINIQLNATVKKMHIKLLTLLNITYFLISIVLVFLPLFSGEIVYVYDNILKIFYLSYSLISFFTIRSLILHTSDIIIRNKLHKKNTCFSNIIVTLQVVIFPIGMLMLHNDFQRIYFIVLLQRKRDKIPNKKCNNKNHF